MDDTAAALLRSMEDGQFIEDMGTEVRNAIAALRKRASDTNLRAKGEITIKLKLTHDPKNVLEVEGAITTKLPKAARGTSIHWTSDDGDILNRKPEKQLELTAVTGAKAQNDPKQPAIKAV